uniref:Uncharacterized protein n=1 Tax=Sinocyclocheilus grahami TaxID=75366 RepID=A0A672M3I8_SINGR
MLIFLTQEVDVGSLCDNIEVCEYVIRIENMLSEKPQVTRVYADDCSVTIASSVATPYGGKLLIGTVYQKALICDLNL